MRWHIPQGLSRDLSSSHGEKGLKQRAMFFCKDMSVLLNNKYTWVGLLIHNEAWKNPSSSQFCS